MTDDRYVPALGFRALTPFYDAVVAATTREGTFKSALIEQAAFKPGERVLDLACGTATLTIMGKRAQPAAHFVGLDGDPEVLKIAEKKADAERAQIKFTRGFSDQLPFDAGSFDKVISSLFFHHLTRDAKLRTFKELARVIKPHGELHVADWGRAQNALMRVAYLGIQMLDGFPNTSDNVAGLLPRFMRDSGFRSVEETGRIATVFGTMSLYRAVR